MTTISISCSFTFLLNHIGGVRPGHYLARVKCYTYNSISQCIVHSFDLVLNSPLALHPWSIAPVPCKLKGCANA